MDLIDHGKMNGGLRLPAGAGVADYPKTHRAAGAFNGMRAEAITAVFRRQPPLVVVHCIIVLRVRPETGDARLELPGAFWSGMKLPDAWPRKNFVGRAVTDDDVVGLDDPIELRG